MSYEVTEVFLTLQGEGHWSGRVAVFCRFAGCNLWSGREDDRASALCTFCDTDFTPRLRYPDAASLVDAVEALWPVEGSADSLAGRAPRMVVLTGGEPTNQVDQALLAELHRRRFYVAVETNGTRRLPDMLRGDRHAYDWVCVSPKGQVRIRATEADELKVVFPQPGVDLDALADFPATHHWLSPMDVRHLADVEEADVMTEENHAAAVDYCLTHPQWRLNVQTHKQIGIR